MASYPASQQIPWLGEHYAAALLAWEQNPTDTVRRLEMSMIAVVMLSLRTREKCWVTDKEMPGEPDRWWGARELNPIRLRRALRLLISPPPGWCNFLGRNCFAELIFCYIHSSRFIARHCGAPHQWSSANDF